MNANDTRPIVGVDPSDGYHECEGDPCRTCEVLDAVPAPDDAAHLAWLRDGDRLARAYDKVAEESAFYGLTTREFAAAIIAALEAQP